MTRNRPPGHRLLMVAATLALLVVPLAGCIGGAGPGADGEDNDTPDDGGNTELPPGERPPDEQPDANRAHVHDRWFATPDQRPPGEATDVVTLIDSVHTIQTVQEDPNQPLDGCRISGERLCWGMEIIAPDDAQEGAGTKVVPPGTEKLTLEVSYDQGNYDGIYIAYQHAGNSGGPHWKELAKRPSGADDGWTGTIDNIDIHDDMTPDPDNGHAEVSQWRFAIEVAGNPAPFFGAPSMTGPDGVDVQLTVEAHRDPSGELPLEPPHPTFYDEDPDGPTQIYEIARVSGDTGTGSFVQAGPAYALTGDACLFEGPGGVCLPMRTGQGLVWETAPGYDASGQDEEVQELPAERAAPLVPPKTQVLKGYIQVDGDAQPQGQIEICLRYVQSTQDPRLGQTFEDECVQYDGSQDRFERTLAIDSQWDSYYADNWIGNTSRWRFLLQIRSPYAGVTVANTFPVHEPGSFAGSVSATIVATSQAQLEEPPSWVFG